MLACVDADYRADGGAVAACLTFAGWGDARPLATYTARVAEVAPYRSGELFRRELPGILRVLESVDAALDAIIVDGYVTLDPSGRPGLGARLFAALGARVAVIGVAKSRYRTATMALPLLRGSSRVPLWITAVGMDPA